MARRANVAAVPAVLAAFLGLSSACSAVPPLQGNLGDAGGGGSSSSGGAGSSGSGSSSSGSGSSSGTSASSSSGSGSSSGGSSSSGSGGSSGSSSGGSSSSGSGGSSSSSGGSSSSGSGGSSSSSGGSSSSSGGSSSSSGGGSDGGQSLEDLCVATVNMYRATINQPPYSRWQAEESCTATEAQKDSVAMKAHSAFGMCGEFGQCECPGWPGPPEQMIVDCLKAMWAEGPGGGHYDIMSSSSYKMVACGFYTLPDGSIWAAQDYK